ncbi:MAG: hypothetical protein HYV07_14150 [Deltaproteobacteria bacterium]|nr:hypothetical protein [Deltaproteobacteria bacterium]
MLRRLLLSATIFALPGCSGCDDDLVAVGDDAGRIFENDATTFPDASQSPLDAGFADSGASDSGVATRVLAFQGTSPVVLAPTTNQDLRFLLRMSSGTPVSNEVVRFQANGTAGMLNVASAITDASGIAIVRFIGGATAGQSTVTATADGASPVSIVVQVQASPTGGLVVNVTSATRIPVTSAEALVYVGTTVPTCAQIIGAATPPTATLAASFAALPGSRTFQNQAVGSRVTVYATGTAASGLVVGSGCAEGTVIPSGSNATVNISLTQRPTTFIGEYDVLLHFQLGDALPHPYDTTVGLVADILSYPAGYAIYATLKYADQQLGFGFVDWTPPGETVERPATYDEVSSNPTIFNTWREASRLLDDLLVSQLGQTYVDITNVGEDVSGIVRDFEVGARWSLEAKTTSGYQITETWRALVYSWQLGCPNGDLGCSRRPMALEGANARYAPAAAVYDVAINLASLPAPGETERFEVIPADHEIVFRYGAVILLALNQLVFPNLPGGLAGNSLGAVLGNIVNCADVAVTLANLTGLTVVPFENLCNAGVAAAAAVVENQLLALDTAGAPGLVGRSEAGLTGGGHFYLLDTDHDLSTELVRDVTVYAQWNDPADPSLTQDVTAPITGAGRRAASNCNTDLDCTGGKVCHAIASYLEVQDVERDCRRKIGSTPGMGACTLDAQCESGLCLRNGASGTCFEACNGVGSCAAGACRADGAIVDLDTVRSGLGEATTDACF